MTTADTSTSPDTHAPAGAAVPTGIENMPFSRALNAGMRRALAENDRVLLMGEDIGPLGGVFRVTEGLQAEFGPRRVIDTPLAESGIVGTAIGLAMAGFRPVCEIQFDGFVFPAFDQITSQLAKITYRHEGALQMPVVIRIPYGGHIGAVEHHQESPEAYFAHTPGLRVVSPSTPNDAYWMIQEAIASNDPVIFMEPKLRYRKPRAEVPEGELTIPLGEAKVVREGRQVTVIAWSAMVLTALEAAEKGAKRGFDLEVIDLRTLVPFDEECVLASVKKTGRVVIVQEAPRTSGFGGELAATIQEKAILHLEAPILRVTGFDTPFPYTLEHEYLPDADRILEAVERVVNF